MASSSRTIHKEYSKRPGTSGIRGHLYETKLLSLIYFRAIHNDSIEEFHLATNVDKIGSFDDICFRAKLRGIDKPLTVFIQAKHRENNSVLTLSNKTDLATLFDSYWKIRRNFKPNNKDVLFEGKFSETKCLFVIYTSAKGDQLTREYISDYSRHLNNLIKTGAPGLQRETQGEPLQQFGTELCEQFLEEQVKALARPIAKCIFGEYNDYQMLMQDELVLLFHVILAQQVFHVSEEVYDGHRVARFREDFFDNNEKCLQLFKEELFTEIFRRRNLDTKVLGDLLNDPGFEDSDDEDVNEERGIRITYKNRKFEFLEKIRSEKSKQFLENINESQITIQRTAKLAVQQCFQLQEFQVPASFGNKDLTIKGGDSKIERKLNDITSKIVELMELRDDDVIIDESLGQGFLQLSGGIASAVGNLLVLDNQSKLLKFTDNYDSLGNLAKRLFDKLKLKISRVNKYRFHVKVAIFPKLSFDVDECSNKIVSDFFKSLIFFTSQSHENAVEEALIYEISDSQNHNVLNVEITPNAIFLKFHDDIQKWWMTPKVGMYLAKEGKLYKDAVTHTMNLPFISILNMMSKIRSKNLTLSELAETSIKSDDVPSGTVFVTDNSLLTVSKFTNQLNNKDHVVLDLEYILNLSARDDQTLRRELANMNEVKMAIVVFDKSLITTSSRKKLEYIANSIKDKIVIIITDQNSVDPARQYFSLKSNLLMYERGSLIDFSQESQKTILENSKVVFQDFELTLDQVLDDKSITYVGGKVLNKIMHCNEINIGKAISNSRYPKSKYNQMTLIKIVRQEPNKCSPPAVEVELDKQHISTLYDIKDDVVLIIGDSGMGKSTLLTHLSLQTKKLDPTIWILRINLLEHSRQLSKWQQDKTAINVLESLKFLCQVALSEDKSIKDDVQIALELSNGAVCLKGCSGDEWTAFELQMFLHYYNTKRLIILFDGFDEICPNYAYEALSLIDVLKNNSQKHKMWITSRSYNKMNSILELQFKELYKIRPLSFDEQDLYLNAIWNDKLKDLDNCQTLSILSGFCGFMVQNDMFKIIIKKHDSRAQITKNKIPILVVYLNLVLYISLNKKVLKTLHLSNCLERATYIKTELDEYVSSPMHLDMMADYVHNQIRVGKLNPSEWEFNLNISDYFYKELFDGTLKRLFEEKNKIDMHKPYNQILYESVYDNFIEKHKKLAAYATFDTCLFDEGELQQMKEMINELKEGEERSGIICNVVNDIPIFMHSSVADYLAVEYICNLIKRKQHLPSLWHFLINVMLFKCSLNVLVTFDEKVKIDKELTAVVKTNNQTIFKLLLEQSKSTNKQIKSCLTEAIRHNLRNLLGLLLSTIENNLCIGNLIDFIKIVKETNMLMLAVKMEFEESIATIVNEVRIIDESKLKTLFENIEIIENTDGVSTDELVQSLHSYLWTRMDIVPEWRNLAEFSGQIYFI